MITAFIIVGSVVGLFAILAGILIAILSSDLERQSQEEHY